MYFFRKLTWKAKRATKYFSKNDIELIKGLVQHYKARAERKNATALVGYQTNANSSVGRPIVTVEDFSLSEEETPLGAGALNERILVAKEKNIGCWATYKWKDCWLLRKIKRCFYRGSYRPEYTIGSLEKELANYRNVLPQNLEFVTALVSELAYVRPLEAESGVNERDGYEPLEESDSAVEEVEDVTTRVARVISAYRSTATLTKVSLQPCCITYAFYAVMWSGDFVRNWCSTAIKPIASGGSGYFSRKRFFNIFYLPANLPLWLTIYQYSAILTCVLFVAFTRSAAVIEATFKARQRENLGLDLPWYKNIIASMLYYLIDDRKYTVYFDTIDTDSFGELYDILDSQPQRHTIINFGEEVYFYDPNNNACYNITATATHENQNHFIFIKLFDKVFRYDPNNASYFFVGEKESLCERITLQIPALSVLHRGEKKVYLIESQTQKIYTIARCEEQKLTETRDPAAMLKPYCGKVEVTPIKRTPYCSNKYRQRSGPLEERIVKVLAQHPGTATLSEKAVGNIVELMAPTFLLDGNCSFFRALGFVFFYIWGHLGNLVTMIGGALGLVSLITSLLPFLAGVTVLPFWATILLAILGGMASHDTFRAYQFARGLDTAHFWVAKIASCCCGCCDGCCVEEDKNFAGVMKWIFRGILILFIAIITVLSNSAAYVLQTTGLLAKLTSKAVADMVGIMLFVPFCLTFLVTQFLSPIRLVDKICPCCKSNSGAGKQAKSGTGLTKFFATGYRFVSCVALLYPMLDYAVNGAYGSMAGIYHGAQDLGALGDVWSGFKAASQYLLTTIIGLAITRALMVLVAIAAMLTIGAFGFVKACESGEKFLKCDVCYSGRAK